MEICETVMGYQDSVLAAGFKPDLPAVAWALLPHDSAATYETILPVHDTSPEEKEAHILKSQCHCWLFLVHSSAVPEVSISLWIKTITIL